MPVRIITLEREYGSGGANHREEIADRLGWKLWDEEITAEIARAAEVDPQIPERCDERVDTLLYRLFRTYARGSYERALSFAEPNISTRTGWWTCCTRSSRTSPPRAIASSSAAVRRTFCATGPMRFTFSSTRPPKKKSSA